MGLSHVRPPLFLGWLWGGRGVKTDILSKFACVRLSAFQYYISKKRPNPDMCPDSIRTLRTLFFFFEIHATFFYTKKVQKKKKKKEKNGKKADTFLNKYQNVEIRF